jgi:transposase
MRNPRKHYAAVEKVAILYNWQKQFFENGAAAFEQVRSAPEKHQERTIAALRDKIQRKNEVVAELMEEHVKLKKELGEL